MNAPNPVQNTAEVAGMHRIGGKMMDVSLNETIVEKIIEKSRKDDELMASFMNAPDKLSMDIAWHDLQKHRFSMAVEMFALASYIKAQMPELRAVA